MAFDKAKYDLAYHHRRRANDPTYSRSRRGREERRVIIRAFREQSCLDCGKDYPWYVMEFDHCRGKKLRNIGEGMGMHQLLAEIEKCDVVCANCHAERTYFRRELAKHTAFLRGRKGE